MNPDDNAPPSVGKGSQTRKKAWQRTIAEQQELINSREEDGWTVVKVRSGNTSPLVEDEKAGIEFIVPKSDANEVSSVIEDNEFDDYVMYRNKVGGSIMLVLELLDLDTETAISVAGDFRGAKTSQMIDQIIDLDEVTFRLSKLDKTVVAEFTYGHYKPLMPVDSDKDGP
ncbi:hypothetical protein K0C01_02055 [Salinarchaeum sp. IM2453]|uniref:DUF7529 family protein n=1 Tax=Salinarchaeum sp. IM2453 TaxID=2862870 RepID=UPI001C82A561|nr:hypothetical protein [Salinarchaeum sp. IM2453]QZA88971.1 hypothetical protein K0C01_02055 [Salinarchaeum sp. IM2453]